MDTTAPFREYFQVAPSHMHNVAVAFNSAISPRIVNNLVLGTNYFLQTFNDVDTRPNPIAAALNTGVTAPTLQGSPTIKISGFATAGATQPTGRVDTTGHLTDTISLNLGRHQLKIGGDTTNSSGATITRPAPGVQVVGSFLQRNYTQNSIDYFIHDNWQVTPRLNLNFGVRYTYLGPLADEKNQITTFVPDKGIVGPGHGLDTLYHRDLNSFGRRLGFAWQPMKDGKTVLRGGWGIYYMYLQ